MKIVDANYNINGRFPQCFNCLKYYPDVKRMVVFGRNEDSYLCFDCVDEMYDLFAGNLSQDEWVEYINQQINKLDWSDN